MPKLLIADDERDIVYMLRTYFVMQNYEVLCAYSGQETIKMAEKQPDLILLDVGMPDMDGFEVCRRIRDCVDCPILFLTARVEESDIIGGFGVGGDDYIVKPFSLKALGARVAAHLRRESRPREGHTVLLDPQLTIDYSRREMRYRDTPIHLAKKEFDIVELLSRHSGQVFDKERIYERIWGLEGDGDSAVIAEHIRRVRQKFAAVGMEEHIQTVWGVGYKWVK